jgi:hypothetical protein
MASCAALKADGGRCRAQAIRDSEWCFNHHPDYAEQRKQRASRGGKRGGRGRPGAEIAELKRDVRQLVDGVLSGQVKPGPAAVAGQLYNALLRAAKLELEIKEQTELIERLEELESRQERRGGGRWHA